MNVLNTTESLKIVRLVHFMLYLFYHNKKKKRGEKSEMQAPWPQC